MLIRPNHHSSDPSLKKRKSRLMNFADILAHNAASVLNESDEDSFPRKENEKDVRLVKKRKTSLSVVSCNEEDTHEYNSETDGASGNERSQTIINNGENITSQVYERKDNSEKISKVDADEGIAIVKENICEHLVDKQTSLNEIKNEVIDRGSKRQPKRDSKSPSVSSTIPEIYQDHAKKFFNHAANCNIFGCEEKKKGGIKILFPEKLHKFLCSDVCATEKSAICWAPHGRCFLVRNPEKFINEITPLIFNHSTMASFQRQLNLYGFKRITRSGSMDEGAYYHEMFLRGRPDLCLLMRRKKIKGCQAKSLTIPTEEPDFYKMEPCNGITSVQQASNFASPGAFNHDMYLHQVSNMIARNSILQSYPNLALQTGTVLPDSVGALLSATPNMALSSDLIQSMLLRKYQNFNTDFLNGSPIINNLGVLGAYDSNPFRQNQTRNVLEMVDTQQPQLSSISKSLLNSTIIQNELNGQADSFCLPFR